MRKGLREPWKGGKGEGKVKWLFVERRAPRVTFLRKERTKGLEIVRGKGRQWCDHVEIKEAVLITFFLGGGRSTEGRQSRNTFWKDFSMQSMRNEKDYRKFTQTWKDDAEESERKNHSRTRMLLALLYWLFGTSSMLPREWMINGLLPSLGPAPLDTSCIILSFFFFLFNLKSILMHSCSWKSIKIQTNNFTAKSNITAAKHCASTGSSCGNRVSLYSDQLFTQAFSYVYSLILSIIREVTNDRSLILWIM